MKTLIISCFLIIHIFIYAFLRAGEQKHKKELEKINKKLDFYKHLREDDDFEKDEVKH